MDDTLVSPVFEVVKHDEARTRPRRNRTNWQPMINALTSLAEGDNIFATDDEVTESDLKYLRLAISRRGKGESLHTERSVRNGQEGRLLWLSSR